MSLIARVNNQSLSGIKGCSRLPVASGHAGVLSVGIHTTSTSNQVSTPTTRILSVPRPLTPFMLFSQENLSKAKRENPKAKFDVVMKTLGQRWASAPKETYSMKYQSLKKEHEQKVAHAAALRKKLAPLLHKPAGGYALFVKEKVKTVQGSGQEKLKKVATQWNQLSAEQKKKYIGEAKKQEKMFSDKMGKLSSKESNALKELTFERRVNRLKRLGRATRRNTLRQLAAKHQRPKKPMVAFSGFLKQNWASLPKGTSAEKVKAAHGKWMALPSAERQKMLDSAKTQLAQYKKDLATWESKMAAAGHKDVVRKFRSRNWKPYLPEGVRVVPLKKRAINPEVRMKRVEMKRARKAKKLQMKRLLKQKLMQKPRKLAAVKKQRMLKLKKLAMLKEKKLQAKKLKKSLKLKKQMKGGKQAKAGTKVKSMGAKAKKMVHKKAAKVATKKR